MNVGVNSTGASDLTNGVTGSGKIVLATSPLLVTPNIGTPSAEILTNATGLPISTGVSGLGTGTAARLANAATGVSSQSTPADPTLTASTTGVMMGLAASITPLNSGNLLILISGDCTDSVISDGCAMQIRFGTGTAPINGAALTGTAAGGVVKSNDAAATGRTPFTLNAIVTGTLSVANWVDMSLAAITGGNASVFDVSVSIVEL